MGLVFGQAFDFPATHFSPKRKSVMLVRQTAANLATNLASEAALIAFGALGEDVWCQIFIILWLRDNRAPLYASACREFARACRAAEEQLKYRDVAPLLDIVVEDVAHAAPAVLTSRAICASRRTALPVGRAPRVLHPRSRRAGGGAAERVAVAARLARAAGREPVPARADRARRRCGQAWGGGRQRVGRRWRIGCWRRWRRWVGLDLWRARRERS